MAQNRTCNLPVTGRPSSPLRHVFKVPPLPHVACPSYIGHLMLSAAALRPCAYYRTTQHCHSHSRSRLLLFGQHVIGSGQGFAIYVVVITTAACSHLCCSGLASGVKHFLEQIVLTFFIWLPCGWFNQALVAAACHSLQFPSTAVICLCVCDLSCSCLQKQL
jgi:hypothetical protein